MIRVQRKRMFVLEAATDVSQAFCHLARLARVHRRRHWYLRCEVIHRHRLPNTGRAAPHYGPYFQRDVLCQQTGYSLGSRRYVYDLASMPWLFLSRMCTEYVARGRLSYSSRLQCYLPLYCAPNVPHEVNSAVRPCAIVSGGYSGTILEVFS